MKRFFSRRVLVPVLALGLAGLFAGCAGDTASQTAVDDSTTGSTAAGGAAGSTLTSRVAGGAPALPPPDSVKVGEIPPDSATRARFKATMQFAHRKNLAKRPPGQIVVALGKHFMGRPYLYGPLDQTVDETPAEQLVCRLDGFDCFTFDEAMLAMARAVEDGSYSYDHYKNYTRQLRYQNGDIGYCNRQHYYTAFVSQAEQEGVLRNVTEQIGGRKRPGFRYAFMGEHRDAYPQMKSDSLYQCIQDVEDSLSRAITYRYIPQDSLRAVYGKLKTGDLISLATDIDGLDVVHTGLVYKGKADTTGLLHASTTGAVKISPDLQSYVKGVDKQTGAIIARPVFGNAGGGGNASGGSD